jgi:hypothetical protein
MCEAVMGNICIIDEFGNELFSRAVLLSGG